MLLDDTVQCPSCQHVLRPDVHAAQGLETASATSSETVAERKCPACGEGVRHGLVRCFNCGTFMSQQVQQSFLRQVAGVPRVERHDDYSSEETASADYSGSSTSDSGIHSSAAAGQAPDDSDDVSLADDEDFEVSPEFTMRAPSEHLKSYKVSWSDSASTPESEAPAPSDDEAATYRIAGSSEPETPAASASPVASEAAPPPSAPAAEPAKETAKASTNGAGPVPALDEGDGVSHSVATGGDVLLQIALDEERQQATKKLRGGTRRRTAGMKAPSAKTANGMLVFCPNGHRIEVKEKHRGMMGRCPKCKMPFFVPLPGAEAAPAGEAKATELDMTTPAAAPAAPGAVAASVVTVGDVRWMPDVALHTATPAKMKPKPGCLAKSFHSIDLGFRPQGMVVVTLVKAGGLFGMGGKKPDSVRPAVQTHFSEGKPAAEAPAAAKLELAKETLSAMKVVQPAVYAHESPFGDVAVFGDGRIAVQLPAHADAAEKQFLSFPLSRFREFVEIVRTQFGLSSFGENCGVPLAETYADSVCHFSEAKLKALSDVPYYQADPVYKLEVVGRQCEGCGIVVSEDARKKEKIGGLDGKGVAKAKCPKCGKKFGNVTLYALGITPAPAK